MKQKPFKKILRGNFKPKGRLVSKEAIKDIIQILGNEKPLTKRAGSVLSSIKLEEEKKKLEKKY